MTTNVNHVLSEIFTLKVKNYLQFVADYNFQSWPLQLCSLAIAIWVLWLLHQPNRHKTINYLFAGCWMWIGWYFYINHYYQLTPLADFYALGFILEGMVFLVFADQLHYFNPFSNPFTKIGYWALAAVFLLPTLAASITAQSWWHIPFVGLMPTPTALATLALLSQTTTHKRWILSVIPFSWCIVFSVMTLNMHIWSGLIPLLLALLMATLLIFEHRKINH